MKRMKRIAGCFLVALLTLLNTGCEKTVLKDLEVQDLTKICPSPSRFENTKSWSEMTHGINNFAYDLFGKVYGESDIFISPFSVSLALSMVTTGASSNTEAQLLKSLGFEGKTTQELDAYYSEVLKNMLTIDPTSTISIANAIWSDRNLAMKPDFVNECSKYFDSAAESVDFSNPTTLDILNGWVSDHTAGKIDRMFDELPDGASAVLANALYFQATWPFEFTRSGNRMLAKVRTSYFYGDGYSGIELPYGNGSFAMRVILPSKGVPVKDVAGKLKNGYDGIEEAVVSLSMPVFSFSYGIGLVDALKSLGVVDAFSSAADFSKMSDQPLMIGDVLHKTFVKVDEKGTEAAALTAVKMFTSSGRIFIPRNIDFKVDRDFLFEIVDRSSNLTVFIGQHKM